MKKVNVMKSVKNIEKKTEHKSRLSKEERAARDQKLKEERAAKKAARLAKREAKKQKEAERKAAAKAKREERKAKRLARLQAEKERKAAQKLKAKERAEAKKAREAALLEKKAAREAKKAERQNQAEKKVKKEPEVKKVSVQDKIEAERNEWKALSAIRRYVKNNAKILEELDGDKLARKIKKFQKMGYTIDVENGVPISIGYDFEVGMRIKVAKPKVDTKKVEEVKSEETEEVEVEDVESEVQQPQDFDETSEPEEKLLTDEEILAAAKEDGEKQNVEILAGDTFTDETELVGDDSLNNSEDDDFNDDDEEEEEDDEEDDFFGRSSGISREQEDYRREAFRDMEGNGMWD